MLEKDQMIIVLEECKNHSAWQRHGVVMVVATLLVLVIGQVVQLWT